MKVQRQVAAAPRRVWVASLVFEHVAAAATAPLYALLILDTPYSIWIPNSWMGRHTFIGLILGLFSALQVVAYPLWSRPGRFSVAGRLVAAHLACAVAYAIHAVAAGWGVPILVVAATVISGLAHVQTLFAQAGLMRPGGAAGERARIYSISGAVAGCCYLVLPAVSRLWAETTELWCPLLFAGASALSLLAALVVGIGTWRSEAAQPHVRGVVAESWGGSGRRQLWGALRREGREVGVLICAFAGWYTFLKFYQPFLIDWQGIRDIDSLLAVSAVGFSVSFWHGVRAVSGVPRWLRGRWVLPAAFALLAAAPLALLGWGAELPLAGLLVVLFVVGFAHSLGMPSLFARWVARGDDSVRRTSHYLTLQAIAKIAAPILAGLGGDQHPALPMIGCVGWFAAALVLLLSQTWGDSGVTQNLQEQPAVQAS